MQEVPKRPPAVKTQLFDPTQAIPKTCPCGCVYFEKVYRVAVVSRLAPGNVTGQDLILEAPIYACRNCGTEFRNETTPTAEEKPAP